MFSAAPFFNTDSLFFVYIFHKNCYTVFMLHTIIAFFKFAFYLIGSRAHLKAVARLGAEGKIAERDALVKEKVAEWTKMVIGLSGSTVEVRGMEHIPESGPFVMVGNHQGYMDIPLLLGYVPKSIAFISKIEILKVPLLSDWMKHMQCVFMDRKDRRQSVEAMSEAVNTVRRGYPLVIFPEGTRSKGGPVAEFKAGSFKLAYRSEAPIVPFTIDGTWRLWEEHKSLRKGHLILTIHPPVPTAGLTKEEQSAIPALIQKTVESALPKEHIRETKTSVKNIEN